MQSSSGAAFGYKRASNAILTLDEPVEALLAANGSLSRIPGVGPKSESVILEVLRTGGSSVVEQAVASSDKAAEIRKQRGLRHNFLSRSRVVQALNEVSPEAPAAGDYRGDLQMHSTWSDGVQTLDEIVQAGLARGYAYSAVTDHSYGLRIAGGMSLDDMKRQHDAIDRLNRDYAGSFRLIKGVEANIGADGSIDMTTPERAALELVLAAPHSALRSSTDQTARMIAAVQAPHVHILAHPRGRMYGRRGGVQANWRDVFDAAAAANVAIEMDGDPWRQDIDYELAAQALDAGCLFALDSDAHSPPELRNAETAIAHARLARVPRERVINCWSAEQLMEWLSTKAGLTRSDR